MAGPAVAYESTRPLTVSSTSLPRSVRGTATRSTAFPPASSQARGHTSCCKHHYCSNKAPEWWTCKKKEVLQQLKLTNNNSLLRDLDNLRICSSLLFGDTWWKSSSPGIHGFLRGIAASEVWIVAQSILCHQHVISCSSPWHNFLWIYMYFKNPFKNRIRLTQDYLQMLLNTLYNIFVLIPRWFRKKKMYCLCSLMFTLSQCWLSEMISFDALSEKISPFH